MCPLKTAIDNTQYLLLVAYLPELSTMSCQWSVYFVGKIWCHVPGQVRRENSVSNKLKKDKLSPWNTNSDISSISISSEQKDGLYAVLWGLEGGDNLCRSLWKEKKCPKFLFLAWISLDEVSFKMHVENFLQIPWLFMASLWHRRIHQRLFQTVTFPQPSFQFNISSKTNAKISIIVPIS